MREIKALVLMEGGRRCLPRSAGLSIFRIVADMRVTLPM